MRILVFHGYLLRGTGSNVYNAELVRALAAAGHEVHILCQDLRPAELPFVDAVGTWQQGALAIDELGRERPPGWGRCAVYRPPIGAVLPVYVADRYEGFDARTFDLLSEAELAHYIAANVAAVSEVAALAGVQCALANHLMMGPAILARGLPADVPYAVKIHGSALEYTVRPHPRFLPYAEEGIAPARSVLVGSLHTARRLWQTIDDAELPARTFLGPPGVDVEAFAPRDRTAQLAGLDELARELRERPRLGYDDAAAAAIDDLFARWTGGGLGEPVSALAAPLAEIRAGFDPAGIDEAAPAAAASVRLHDGPLITFVGKLIASKGVELLLAALPLVRREVPDVRLAIAGFGAYREGLELLVRALGAGEIGSACEIAAAGRALESGEAGELVELAAFLDSLRGEARDRYVDHARGLGDCVEWFGRIEHDLLVHLVAAADVQVVPSTFPEAFGMVAAEAAACAVVPVCAHHSGLAEVTDQLAAGLAPADAALLDFELGDTAVDELAARLVTLLTDAPRRAAIGGHVAAVAQAKFAWGGVAENVVAAALGERDSLRKPV